MKALSQVILVAFLLQAIVIANLYSFQRNTVEAEFQKIQVVEFTGIIG